MESVKLTVQVVDAQLTQLENRVNALKNTPISLKINATGLDKATKDTTALIKACTKLVEAQVQVTKAENALEKQRLSTEASANRARTAEANLAKQHAATATEQARLATQQEKTATAAKNLEIQQEKTNTAVAKGEAAANRASLGFGTLLSTYLQFAAISAVRSGISDAFETMKDVDTQIINIQKVTDATDAAMDTLSERAYSTASKYGVAANEYLAAAAAFAKAGYSNYEELAELATKTQLVGDVTADVASKFLLSADAAYKFGGNADELATVLDKANVIENNYATSIEKMAAGFPNVASTASMAKVSIDELMAALGTVTAVTQESGEKASYALRSLFLNILGDVGAEIDETTKVTADSVNTLWGVISKYADESLIAAHNAGELIDPMEAIRALSEAQKDNLLEEADLMQIVMALGGKLRTNQLNALISNYDMYEEMLAQVKTATGSADKEVATMSKSWEASLKRLRNTWTQFVSHVVSSDVLTKGINLLETLIKLLDNGFVSAAAKAVILLSVIKMLSGAFGKFAGSLGDTLDAVRNLPRYLQMLTANEKALEAAGLSAAGAQTALSVAMGGVLTAITLLVTAYVSAKQSAAELTESLKEGAAAASDSAEEHMEAASKIAELYGAYEEAAAAGTNATTVAEGLSDALKDVGLSADLAKGSLSDYAKEALVTESMSSVEQANIAVAKAGGALLNAGTWTQTGESSVNLNSLRSKGFLADSMTQYDWMHFIDPNISVIGAGKHSLWNAQDPEEVLRYYDLLVETMEEVDEAAAKGHPELYTDSDVKELQNSIDYLTPLVEEYRQDVSTLDKAKGQRDALLLDTSIASQEAFDAEAQSIKEASDLSDDYKESYLAVLNDLYPMYAEQAAAAEDAAAGVAEAGEENERFVDTLFDETGALKDSAAAMLDTNAALRDMALDQAKEDADNATDAFNSLVESLGGSGNQSVVKALELLSMNSEDAEAALAELGAGGDEVREYMEQLGPAMDEVNLTKERYNELSKATAETTAAANVILEKAAAAARGEAGAADALQAALRNADSATIELAQAQANLQAESARANFSNLVKELGGVSAAAIQTTLAMYAAYKAISAGGMPKGATSGAGYTAKDIERMQQLQAAEKEMEDARNLATSLGNYVPSTSYGGGSSGGGGSSAASKATDEYLESLQKRVTLLKQELTLLEVKGSSVDDQVKKQRELQAALSAQMDYMRSIGSDEVDILSLSTEWWRAQNDITKLLESGSGGESYSDRMELLKQELSLLEARGASVDEQIAKQREIQELLHEQADYLRSIGGDAADILSLSTEWWKIENDIAELLKSGTGDESYDDRMARLKQELAFLEAKGASTEEQIAKQREIQELLHSQAEYLRSIGADETDILSLSTEWWNIENNIKKLLESEQNAANEAKEKQLELEEKILAVQEAQAALANAENERNIRVFNSKTGQWEWIANASDVSNAKDALKDAQDSLSEFDGDKSGYEDVISKLLTYDPNAQTAGSTFSAEGVVRAAGAGNAMTNATTTNSIGQQMNGNIYQIAGMSFTEEQARGITLYDLAQMSNNLTIYSRGI